MAKTNPQHTPAPHRDDPPPARYGVFIVQDADESTGGRALWHRVAKAFPHGNGKGFNIEIPPGMSLTGRLVLRMDEPRDAPTRPNDDN